MAKVGFDTLQIGIYDEGSQIIQPENIFTYNAVTEFGRPQSLNVTNLSKGDSTAWAGDGPRIIRGSGAGAVQAVVGTEGLPIDVLAKVLGLQKSDQGYYRDNKTIAPYVALNFIAHDHLKNRLFYALFYAHAEAPSFQFSTSNANPVEEYESITFNASYRSLDGRIDDLASEADEGFDYDQWIKYVFGDNATVSTTTQAPTTSTTTENP